MERPPAAPEPPLSDGMIVLRPWRREDAPVLASVFGSGDAELAYWIGEVPQPAHGRSSANTQAARSPRWPAAARQRGGARHRHLAPPGAVPQWPYDQRGHRRHHGAHGHRTFADGVAGLGANGYQEAAAWW